MFDAICFYRCNGEKQGLDRVANLAIFFVDVPGFVCRRHYIVALSGGGSQVVLVMLSYFKMVRGAIVELAIWLGFFLSC